MVIKETSGHLFVVGWNDSSNEEVCNGNEKNDQKNNLSLEWHRKREITLDLLNKIVHNYKFKENAEKICSINTILLGLEIIGKQVRCSQSNNLHHKSSKEF